MIGWNGMSTARETVSQNIPEPPTYELITVYDIKNPLNNDNF